jgi:TRAP-type C4-dicarboxylate transport system permease small subunit
MSWRTIAAVLIVVFSMLAIWGTLADPLVQISNAFIDLETSGQFNTDAKISRLTQSVFNMILIGVFGVMAWGIWRVVRRELTRGGGL